jgi:hypothetical protein
MNPPLTNMSPAQFMWRIHVLWVRIHIYSCRIHKAQLNKELKIMNPPLTNMNPPQLMWRIHVI